ncbi:MAG: hypothetical protein QOF33_579, partial [Thermomicrobiales bacterium]|nr:hypothetical protein [Thermomicrobiales bacterium]
FGPGHLVLLDDRTGRGHNTVVVGEDDVLILLVWLAQDTSVAQPTSHRRFRAASNPLAEYAFEDRSQPAFTRHGRQHALINHVQVGHIPMAVFCDP